MISAILYTVMSAQVLLPPGLDPAAPATAPAQVMTPAQATTQQAATSQPVAVVARVPQSAADLFAGTTLGQVFRGERVLTLDDIKQPWFWVDTIRNLIEAVLVFIPRLIGTLVFLFVFWLIYRGIRRMMIASMRKAQVDESIRDMLSSIIRWVVMGFGLVIACNQLGIPIVAMLTGVSIIGLAVGFAAQETLSNFIAGIVIFIDRPFGVGDWVTIDGEIGQVQRVTFRSTRILNLDGEVVVLPNTHMLSNKLVNRSAHPVQRVNVEIGIAYKSSIDAARQTLLALVKEDKRIVAEPAPNVIVNECADSSVNLILRFWIRDESIERSIRAEYLEKSKKALDAAEIEIPFPHMQLVVEESPALASLTGNGSR